MNKLILFLITIVLFACGSDNKEQDPTPEVINPPGAPSWVSGYPLIAYGAVSVDLNFQTDKASKVYWIVTNKAISLSAEQIKAQAKAPSNDAIKFNGVIETAINEKKIKTVSGLEQNTKYFTYVVAENKSDEILQTLVDKSDFITYYRQDTSKFTSTVESREALYLIYRPEEVLKYPSKKYPILFFMGGNGEVATVDKPINVIRNGSLPEYIKKGNDVPMIVMSLQHTVQDWKASFIAEGVNHGLKTYPVDTKKVYMTGISGGGFGCWSYAVDNAAKLTAIVPISGGGNNGKACNLKNVAIWAFHNQTDNTVNASNSVNMINAVKACSPNEEVKLSIFPDTGHDCWRRVYDQNHPDWNKDGKDGIAKVDIYAWLLSKSK